MNQCTTLIAQILQKGILLHLILPRLLLYLHLPFLLLSHLPFLPQNLHCIVVSNIRNGKNPSSNNNLLEARIQCFIMQVNIVTITFITFSPFAHIFICMVLVIFQCMYVNLYSTEHDLYSVVQTITCIQELNIQYSNVWQGLNKDHIIR